jgi:hypothetical protein
LDQQSLAIQGKHWDEFQGMLMPGLKSMLVSLWATQIDEFAISHKRFVGIAMHLHCHHASRSTKLNCPEPFMAKSLLYH